MVTSTFDREFPSPLFHPWRYCCYSFHLSIRYITQFVVTIITIYKLLPVETAELQVLNWPLQTTNPTER